MHPPGQRAWPRPPLHARAGPPSPAFPQAPPPGVASTPPPPACSLSAAPWPRRQHLSARPLPTAPLRSSVGTRTWTRVWRLRSASLWALWSASAAARTSRSCGSRSLRSGAARRAGSCCSRTSGCTGSSGGRPPGRQGWAQAASKSCHRATGWLCTSLGCLRAKRDESNPRHTRALLHALPPGASTWQSCSRTPSPRTTPPSPTPMVRPAAVALVGPFTSPPKSCGSSSASAAGLGLGGVPRAEPGRCQAPNAKPAPRAATSLLHSFARPRSGVCAPGAAAVSGGGPRHCGRARGQRQAPPHPARRQQRHAYLPL